jgi:hypothetical protein
MKNRRSFLKAAGASIAAPAEPWDLLVYGATPGGIAAALAAAGDGARVLLAEPTGRIGGLMTCGLSHTDFRTFEGITGAYFDLSRRVAAYYASTYGRQSRQYAECMRGTQAEPKVSLLIMERMLAERPRIRIERGWRLVAAQVRAAAGGRQISGVTFEAGNGSRTVGATVYIDATYEGDLLAAAGVAFRAGRESRAEYGESLAPEQADNQLQGYNFRFAATRDPANRAAPGRPAGYRREDFAGILPLLTDGRIKRIFGYPRECVYKAQIPVLPNGKYDINDVSGGPVRLSLPGENLEWPEGDGAARRRIFDRHVLWNTGLLWFLQNDEAVPARFRDEAREWGWCKDEFTESGNLPPQLYVREARRMTGLRIFTEGDTAHAPGDARAVLHRDSIAMGDYGPNCHGTWHEGSRFGGRHSGEFYKPVPPYQIPYGTLVPREVANLLVPVAASSSHIGFCALRLEPIWMSLGQAAGHAASLSGKLGVAVQTAPVPRLQSRLWSAGAATIYMSDIPPGHPDFAAVQWWGTAGGFHGLAPMPSVAGQRGKNLIGQYFEAFPNHAADLSKPLDSATKERWTALALSLGVAAGAIPVKARTRGDWIRAMWAHKRASNPSE